MRLRQVAVLVADLEDAVQLVDAVFGESWHFCDPKIAEFGMDHVVIPWGGDFLEILAPQLGVESAAQRYLARRGADTGYMVILHDLDPIAHRDRLRTRGVRVVHQVNSEPNVAVHYHPKDSGGVLLDINGDTRTRNLFERLAPWPHCGDDWPRYASDSDVLGLLGVTLVSNSPEEQCRSWSVLVDRQVGRDGDGHPLLKLDLGCVRFTEQEDLHSGLRGLDVLVRDIDTVCDRARARGLEVTSNSIEMLGCTFRLFDHSSRRGF